MLKFTPLVYCTRNILAVIRLIWSRDNLSEVVFQRLTDTTPSHLWGYSNVKPVMASPKYTVFGRPKILYGRTSILLNFNRQVYSHCGYFLSTSSRHHSTRPYQHCDKVLYSVFTMVTYSTINQKYFTSCNEFWNVIHPRYLVPW